MEVEGRATNMHWMKNFDFFEKELIVFTTYF